MIKIFMNFENNSAVKIFMLQTRKPVTFEKHQRMEPVTMVVLSPQRH